MIKRPIFIPLLVFIIVIILVDSFLPTIFLRDHYIKYLNQTTTFKYLIVDSPSETPKTFSYTAKIIAYKDPSTDVWEKTNGKIKIYISKTSKEGKPNKLLNYGDVIIMNSNLQPIRNFDSSSSFDYAKYMRHKRIYHQVFAKDFVFAGANQGNKIIAIAQKTNLWLKHRLHRTNMGENQKNLATALLLGDKKDLSRDIRQDFNISGLAHILCVSGLHIMMIVGAFSFVLRKIVPLGLKGLYIRYIVMVLLSWIMAFIVGLTPSALRVATMLSLLTLSRFTSLDGDRINILFVTAFVFLCFDPLVLFNISFQLSFLAVLGIVSISPYLENLFKNYLKKKKSFLKTLLSNAIATTSAQVFTFPIILLNFGRFPIFFLLTNLIVIPFLQLILVSIIVLIVFCDVPLLNTALGYICDLEMSGLLSIASIADKLTII